MPVLETLRDAIKRIKEFTRSQPADYPALLWAILVFLGGAINAVAINHFADWYQFIQQYTKTNFNTDLLNYPQAYPSLIVYGSIVFVLPLILSILFSRNHPEKRLVPPLYMQLISVGFLLALAGNSLILDFPKYYFIVTLAGIVGIVQDRIVITALGRTVIKDDIIRYSLKISAGFKETKSLMTTKQFLRIRGLKIIEGEHGESLKFKTQGRRLQRNFGFQFFMELIEGNQSEESIINIAAYELQSYGAKHITEGDDTDENAKNKIATLTSFLERHEIEVTPDSADKADSLVSYVMDEMEGMVTRVQRMPTRKLLVIIASVFSVIAGIGLLVFGKVDLGISVLALAAFLILDGVFRE